MVLVDKPAGWSSFDVVRWSRRGVKGKVGHAGTLDPFATGLVLLLVGQASRLSSLLMDLTKEYFFTVQFGVRSSTGDPTGELEKQGRAVTRSEVASALPGLTGRLCQKVPMASAVRVGGERLYHKARRGEVVETPSREVVVYDLALLDFDEERQTAELMARTAKGTYIRQLAEDLGTALGTAAYAAALRRTRVGLFHVDQALGPDDLSPEVYARPGRGVLTLSDALSFLPQVTLGPELSARARNGNRLEGVGSGRFRVRGPEGLLAVYERVDTSARPLVVFPSPED